MVGLVQGVLIRRTIPLLGQKKSVYTGFFLCAVGMILFAVATLGWMMYLFTAIYCLGGLAGPALQGIISNHVPANEQGELQGGLTSLISITAIVGPPVMAGLFSWFTRDHSHVYLPGAPFIAGAVLMLAGLLFAYRTLYNEKHARAV